MQQSHAICESCKHSMLTKIEVMIQANKQERNHIIPIGISKEKVTQPWCFHRGAGIPISMPVIECEGFEPSDAPKVLHKPTDFEQGKEDGKSSLTLQN